MRGAYLIPGGDTRGHRPRGLLKEEDEGGEEEEEEAEDKKEEPIIKARISYHCEASARPARISGSH